MIGLRNFDAFGRAPGAALAVWLAAATAVCAEAAAPLKVSVRETGDSSQVGVAIDDKPFSVERTADRQVDFVSPAVRLDADLSQFAGIRATSRVTDARLVRSESETRIRFLLDCECPFSMTLTGGLLTLRFTDPTPPPETAALDEPPPQRRRPPAPGGTANAPATSPSPLPRGAANIATDLAAAPPPADDTGDDEVLRARQRLLEQLSRAADQGLLELAADDTRAALPDAPPPDAPVDASVRAPNPDEASDVVTEVSAPPPDAAPEASPAQRPGAPPVLTKAELSLRARTAHDKAFRADRAEAMAPAAPCLDEGRLDPRGWDADRPYFEAAATLRSSMLDDFDAPNRDVVLTLARLQLVWGLGAEARQLIRLFGAQETEERVLADLASISEGDAPPPDGYFARRAPCGPRAAMWRLAAGLGGGPDEPTDEAMIGAFAETPPRLRNWLGPILVSRALDADRVDLADGLDRILRRGDTPSGADYDLARARLNAALGDHETAEATLRRIAESRSPAARDALLRLFDTVVANGETPSKALAAALDDAAYLARGGAYARPLGRAAVMARAASEGLPSALATARMVGAAERRDEDPLAQDAIHAAIEAARPPSAEDPDDALAYAVAARNAADLISTRPDGDAARARLSTELTRLGLANLAAEALQPAEGRGGGDLALARAYVALGLDDGAGALAALDGVEGSAAARLRAEGYELLGEAAAALRAASAISGEDPDASANRALRAGAWSEAAAAGPAATRVLAAYMAGAAPEAGPDDPRSDGYLAPPQLGNDPTLTEARRLLDASARSRELILEALTDG